MTLALLASGCDDRSAIPIVPPGSLPTADAWIVTESDTVHLTVEVASKPNERAYGLMDRDHLAADEGMLFLFEDDRPEEASFYMYRTRIPLDIAYADSTGTIVSILTMEPCASPVSSYCDRYAAGAVHRVALEANGGYFSSKGVKVGDRLMWEVGER